MIYKSLLRIIFKRKQFDTIVSFMEGEAVRLHSYLMDKSENNVSWVHIDFQKKHWSADFFRSDEQEESIYTALQRIIFVSSDAFDSFLRLFQKVDASKCRFARAYHTNSYVGLDRNYAIRTYVANVSRHINQHSHAAV